MNSKSTNKALYQRADHRECIERISQLSHPTPEQEDELICSAILLLHQGDTVVYPPGFGLTTILNAAIKAGMVIEVLGKAGARGYILRQVNWVSPV